MRQLRQTPTASHSIRRNSPEPPIRNCRKSFCRESMSSESDSALSVGSSGEEGDVMVESDEELLNDDTVERKDRPSHETHKRSYDSRYAVPTLEERQLMRDAEMQVELSMLEMEVGCCVRILPLLGTGVRGKYPAGSLLFGKGDCLFEVHQHVPLPYAGQRRFVTNSASRSRFTPRTRLSFSGLSPMASPTRSCGSPSPLPSTLLAATSRRVVRPSR